MKNALANVARGGAAALVAVIVPPFLTRLMSPQGYGTWCLVLQLGAYMGYLDFGIQTAVGRFVAHANERGDGDHQNQIVSTAFAALCVAGISGIIAIAGVAILLPQIFRQMPSGLVGDARIALLFVASSLALGLPAAVFSGIFVGLQRNEVPAAIIGGSRILGAVVQVIVVEHGGNLAEMGVAVAAVNLASCGVQYLMYRKLTSVKICMRLVSRRAGHELFNYCWSLTIWSLMMLFVMGLDLTLVGAFQFGAVAYYAVAASLITFIAGLQNSIFSAIVAPVAVLHARGDSQGLGRVMIAGTRYGTFLLLATGLPLIFCARAILSLWVGPVYAASGTQLLQILVAANIIRLSATPYVMTLIGTGQQRLVTLTPMLEGFTNLFVSVIGGLFYGAIGVAVGTLIGALVGITGNCFYNMRRTTGLAFRMPDYLRDGIVRPLICTLPLVTYALTHVANSFASTTGYWGFVVALLATAIVVWRWGLVSSERDKLRSWRLALGT